jgi:hypothetical protein
MAATPEPFQRGFRTVVVERSSRIRIFVFGREQLFDGTEAADLLALVVVEPRVLLSVRLYLQRDAPVVVVLDVLGDAAQRVAVELFRECSLKRSTLQVSVRIHVQRESSRRGLHESHRP